MDNKYICEFCGKEDERTVFVKDLNMRLCKRHSSQYYEMGKIYKRTMFDPNEIIEHEEYAEIILYNRNNEERARAIIDLEDICLVKDLKWNYAIGYAYNHKNKIHLHNFILNRTPDKKATVDHINRNRLDNRKSNLRIVDYKLNGFNKGKQSNNTSGYVGVSWDKAKKKWEAHIKVNRKKKFLGYFDDIENAVTTRKEAEIKYYGEIRDSKHDIHTIYKDKELNVV